MTATVWVIEQGSYSDYRVCGVFSSQAGAQQIADAINVEDHYDKATISEWPLDPGVAELNAGLSLYFVQIQKDGTVERCERRDLSAYDMDDVSKPRMWRRTQAPSPSVNRFPDVLWVTAWADSDVMAIKIANEKRAQFIASGEWDAPGEEAE